MKLHINVGVCEWCGERYKWAREYGDPGRHTAEARCSNWQSETKQAGLNGF